MFQGLFAGDDIVSEMRPFMRAVSYLGLAYAPKGGSGFGVRLLDRDQDGEFLHFYTQVIGGRVFFEAVQRVDDYAGYGEANGPIRMAAHRRARVG